VWPMLGSQDQAAAALRVVRLTPSRRLGCHLQPARPALPTVAQGRPQAACLCLSARQRRDTLVRTVAPSRSVVQARSKLCRDHRLAVSAMKASSRQPWLRPVGAAARRVRPTAAAQQGPTKRVTALLMLGSQDQAAAWSNAVQAHSRRCHCLMLAALPVRPAQAAVRALWLRLIVPEMLVRRASAAA